MIQQIYNERELVQTELVVSVDGVYVYYRKLECFAYEFCVIFGPDCPCKTIDQARFSVNEVINTVVMQSHSHGCKWNLGIFQEEKEDIELNNKYYIARAYFSIVDDTVD